MSRNDLSIWSLQCRGRVIDLLTKRSKGFTPIVSEWGNLFRENRRKQLTKRRTPSDVRFCSHNENKQLRLMTMLYDEAYL